MKFFNEEITQILLNFLNKKVEQVQKEIMEKGILSEENAIPLILKTQFNHIVHLDSEITALREMVEDRFEKIENRVEKIEDRVEKIEGRIEKIEGRFEKIDDRFENMDTKISRIFTLLGVGFGVISALIVIFQFIG